MITKRSPFFMFYSVLTAALAVGYVLYAWLNWTLLLDRHFDRMQVLSAQMEKATGQVFGYHMTMLNVIGSRLVETGAVNDPDQAKAIIDQVVDTNPGLLGVGLARLDGTFVTVVGIEENIGNLLQHPTSADRFRFVLESRKLAGGPTTYYPGFEQWAVPIRIPLFDKQGNMLAVLSAGFSIREQDTLLGTIKLMPETTMMIISREALVRYSSSASGSPNEPLYIERIEPQTMALLERAATGEKIRLKNSLLCDDCYLTVRDMPSFHRSQFIVVLYPFSVMLNFYFMTMALPSILLSIAAVVLFVVYRFFNKQQARYESKILRMAQYDSLTNLPNRPFAMDQLDASIRLASREGWKLAVLFVDLDNFKDINDAYGHHAGDELLKVVATRLCCNVKSSDTVARLAGDEFIIILRHVSRQDNVDLVARRLLEVFEQPINLPMQDVFVSPSIGMAIYPDDALTADELLKNADVAMYRAKDAGRNRVVSYSRELHAQNSRAITITTQLRKAVENGEFYLVYQPQYDLTSGKIVGVEALCRWDNAELGAVSPLEFIPAAEANGQIVKIGEWVLNEACKARAKLEVEWGAPLRMSVNVSVRQVREPNFHVNFNSILKANRTRPDQIELEITESLLLDQFALKVLKDLGDAGYSIAVDDFGTGYAALANLQKFPVHTLKIDRSFLASFPANQDSYTLVNAIVGLAKSFKFNIVAEGIEDSGQKSALVQMGCGYGQGFGLCKPKRLTEFIAGGNKVLHLDDYKQGNYVV